VIRFLLHFLISLITAAAGLLLAALIIPGVKLEFGGFLVAIVVFAIAQGILGPLVSTMAQKYASAILGGIGLVTTLLALFVATLISGGLRIEGIGAWALATLVVWIVTALGGWILAYFLIQKRLDAPKPK
jgi:uncharacterized membrane protein YvlD (DUF360 family)